jgi:hypothetical protein
MPAPTADTSMQVDSAVRDEPAAVAEHDFNGVSMSEALRRLLKERKIGQVTRQYEELRADPEERASYAADARLTDKAASDGLGDAREEYPEYNS